MSARRFGDAAVDIVLHLARVRVREVAEAMGEKARANFPGVSVEHDDREVRLKGRGLRRRMLSDGQLRRPFTWLK